MDKKTILSSLLSFAVTIIFLAATIFAWFTLQSSVSIDDFVVNVHDLKSDIKLEIIRNGEEPVLINSEEDFNNVFSDALPSYTFLFRLTITNESTRDTTIKVVLNNISNVNLENEDYDMRDVFYLKDGIVNISGTEFNIEPQEWDQESGFNKYSLNNLIEYKNIVLLNNFAFETQQQIVIEFTIVYDENTSAVKYQTGKLHIDGIYIYNN